jgi:lysophospholipase L1-like esterase
MNGNRVKDALKTVCILATITLLVLAIVETVSFVVLSRSSSEAPSRPLHIYDQSQTWPKKFWQEYDASRKFTYRPYVVWRRAPYAGETIVVDREGLRRTEHSLCGADAYTIYMFGGSTLWGTGAPDSGTIPSLLAQQYTNAGRKVCVRNYGETAWVSTQEVIELLLELKHAERKPDLVIFYDGVNDVYAAWQSGRSDVHQNFDRIKAQFETRSGAGEGTFNYLLLTNTAQMLQHIAARGRHGRASSADDQRRPSDPAQIAQASTVSYLRNIDVVGALAKEYGFSYVFFWQPVIFAGDKPLTAGEQEIRESRRKAWPGVEELYQKTYELVRRENRPHLFYIADVFGSYKDNLYLDFAHLPPEGNRLVAARMYEVLRRLGL